jgi:hypothetical protein
MDSQGIVAALLALAAYANAAKAPQAKKAVRP